MTATLAEAKPATVTTFRHIPALDGVRGVAVLLVLLAHAGVFLPGGVGVDVFFVLSGFLITGLIAKEVEATGGLGYRNFYMRRILRLLPALVATCCLYVAFAVAVRMWPKVAVKESIIAMMYSTNWVRAFWYDTRWLGHTWSLSVEEQFYMVWPVSVVLLLRLGRQRAALACAAMAGLVMAYRGWLGASGASVERIYNGSDTRADTLFIGAAIALAGQMPARAASWAGWGGLAGLVGVMLALVALPDMHFMFTATTLGAAGLVVGILRGGLLDRAFAVPWLAWVGKISYGLYLYHYLVMSCMAWYGAGPLLLVAVGIPVSFGMAAASYYLMELRFLRLKRAFR